MKAAALTSTGDARGGEQLEACRPAAGVSSQATAGPGCSRRRSQGSLTPGAGAGDRHRLLPLAQSALQPCRPRAGRLARPSRAGPGPGGGAASPRPAPQAPPAPITWGSREENVLGHGGDPCSALSPHTTRPGWRERRAAPPASLRPCPGGPAPPRLALPPPPAREGARGFAAAASPLVAAPREVPALRPCPGGA